MFRDRQEAAERLAAELGHLGLEDPVICGIPRGGVVIAAILARRLSGDLDVVLARKLRHPLQPELAIGAVAEDGYVYLYESALGIGRDEIHQETERQLDEIRRRRELVRAILPPAPIKGRPVVVTDDGIATGSTMIAALHAMRAQGASEVIAAVPVGPRATLRDLESQADQVICLESPADFFAIGLHYQDFRQVDDAEVQDILREYVEERRRRSA